MTFEMEWFGDKILQATNSVVAKTSKKVAHNVMEDAKKILEQKADKTTADGLLSQFYVKESKFKNGGSLVYCQGPDDWHPPYHASFVEMGTPKTGVHPYGNKNIPAVKLPAMPFMRPAMRKNRRKANNMFQDDLDSWLKTG